MFDMQMDRIKRIQRTQATHRKEMERGRREAMTFKFEWLGIMFAGMALQRTFQGAVNASRKFTSRMERMNEQMGRAIDKSAIMNTYLNTLESVTKATGGEVAAFMWIFGGIIGVFGQVMLAFFSFLILFRKIQFSIGGSTVSFKLFNFELKKLNIFSRMGSGGMAMLNTGMVSTAISSKAAALGTTLLSGAVGLLNVVLRLSPIFLIVGVIAAFGDAAGAASGPIIVLSGAVAILTGVLYLGLPIWMLLAVIIGGIVLLLGLVTGAFKGAGEAAGGFFEGLGNIAHDVIKGIADMFNWLGKELTEFFDKMVEDDEDRFEKHKEQTKEWLDSFLEGVNNVLSSIGEAWDNFWNGLSSFAGDIWDFIVWSSVNIWDWITGGAKSIWDWIVGTATSVWDWIILTAQNIWNWITGGLKGIWEFIVWSVQIIWNWIGGVARSIWEWITWTVQNVGDWVTGTLGNIWDWFTNMSIDIADIVGGTLGNIWNWFSGGIGDFTRGLSSGWDDFWGGIGRGIEDFGKWLGFQEGGPVRKTGPAVVHAGEYVLSKKMMNTLSSFQNGGISPGGLTITHKKEMILPRDISEGLMKMIRGARVAPSKGETLFSEHRGGNTYVTNNFSAGGINMASPVDAEGLLRELDYKWRNRMISAAGRV